MRPIVVAHDYLTQRGGAERVALAMAQALPGSQVLTTLYDPDGTYPEFADLPVTTSPLQRVPYFRRNFKAALPLFPGAIRAMGPVDTPVLVSSSTAFAHGLESIGCHISYIHSPAHWLWETARYARGHQARLIRLIERRFRTLDVAAAQRPHLVLTNSAHSATKILETYGRRAEVLPPPVPTRPMATAHGDYFLVVSRLLPYKRVDLVIAAARRLHSRLVVVGRGPERRRLEGMAGPGVEFRADVAQPELDALFARCLAVVVGGEEDLGLVPIEANSAGRPAVAYAKGGALETVVDGRTGVLFEDARVEEVATAMATAAEQTWDGVALQRHAANWSEDVFAHRLRVLVDGFPRSCRRCGGEGLGPDPMQHLLSLDANQCASGRTRP